MQIAEYPLSSVDPARWNTLLALAGNKSPFCRYEWLKLIAHAFPERRVGVLLAEEPGGELVGGLPFVDNVNCLSRQSHCLPWGTPAGVILTPGVSANLAEDLLAHWINRLGRRVPLRRLSITFPHDNPPGSRLLKERSFNLIIEEPYAVQLAHKSFAHWEASLKPEVRNQNRQALRRGAVFEQVSSPAAAAQIYSLAVLSARRHKRCAPLLTERFYRLLLDPEGPLAEARDLVRLFMVRVAGKPAAYSVCLVHAGKLWLWDYGADETTFEARPNNLMYRSIIAVAFREGLEEVDLGAAPPGAESLGHFKRNFGGRPYRRLSAVYATPLFSLGAAARAHLYRLIRR